MGRPLQIVMLALSNSLERGISPAEMSLTDFLLEKTLGLGEVVVRRIARGSAGKIDAGVDCSGHVVDCFGHVQGGDDLPSERHLATELQTSRETACGCIAHDVCGPFPGRSQSANSQR